MDVIVVSELRLVPRQTTFVTVVQQPTIPTLTSIQPIQTTALASNPPVTESSLSVGWTVAIVFIVAFSVISSCLFYKVWRDRHPRGAEKARRPRPDTEYYEMSRPAKAVYGGKEPKRHRGDW